ncbi:MAG: RNA-binding transcriptional accessory protein [Deltaproteobacteria bacterium]|nr:RNA-binding transcriptional accessory protein [Deltaproteobacteria bacterium]
MAAPSFDPTAAIVRDLKLPAAGVAVALRLFGEGSTVPFIARYRKEATGGLDETQLRAIEERRDFHHELESRRDVILRSIEEQGKLSDELRAQIGRATSKAELEDLYLPFKPKRRTRATIAREKGLEPLGLRILAQPVDGDPWKEAARLVGPDQAADADEALAGARDIAAEAVAEDAAVRAMVRRTFAEEGLLISRVTKEHAQARSKFEQYYEYRESVRTVPSHRFLAVRRGEQEGVLKVGLEIEPDRLLPKIAERMGVNRRSPFAQQLIQAILDGYKRLLAPSAESDVLAELKVRSDRAAVEIFADNLRNLLLAPPLGGQPVIGIDPGIRTGCKCAAVDETGKFLAHLTIYPGQGDAQTERARRDLLAFIETHRPVAVAVGNGTAGRETESFVREVLKASKERPFVVPVSESGASVYSASERARDEFPELDVTIRGAISIARRLQDPLAELVKIEPSAIGVGQYQHDLKPELLEKKLDEVVESCVNHVGVELNTASGPLLARVAGIGPKLAQRIVAHRERRGSFAGRGDLLEVSGLGPRTFEQAAGFLRIRGGAHPLDASAVHPERYALVERMARDLGVALSALVGDAAVVERIPLRRYVGDGVGEPTLVDIQSELKKPGRDPRANFEPPKFREDVTKIEDLKPGMALEGVVTNVVAFGAFVDVGVHQDGLVHVSQLSDRFIKDPADAVRVGDRLAVRVLEVDLVRKRISLSAKSAPS